MKVSTEIDNNFGYEKITQLVDNIPLIYNYLYMQSVLSPLTFLSSNPAQDRCTQYNMYVIKFVSDLRHVGGFFRVLQFSSPIKLTATI
jgi:hypothetical protein